MSLQILILPQKIKAFDYYMKNSQQYLKRKRKVRIIVPNPMQHDHCIVIAQDRRTKSKTIEMTFFKFALQAKFCRPYRSVPILPITTTLDQPTLSYSLNVNFNQLNRLGTRLDKQHGLRTVEAKTTELDLLRNVEAGRLRMRHSLLGQRSVGSFLQSEHTSHFQTDRKNSTVLTDIFKFSFYDKLALYKGNCYRSF